ncbi:LysR substrate-binding domain-containing protein (plasmid) [Cupriavidus basilensis]
MPEHPLAARCNVSLEDLAGEEWILPPRRILLRQQMEAAFHAQGLPPPRLRAEMDSNRSAMLGLVQGSRCLSLCGQDALEQLAHLRPLNISRDKLDLRRRIGVLHRSGAYLTPVVHRLIEILKERCAGSPRFPEHLG